MMDNSGDFIGPVNLGNPGEFSMLELAEKIIDLTHSQSKIVYGPLPPDDPMQRRPDITLAKEKLEWKPEIDLEEGLKKTTGDHSQTIKSALKNGWDIQKSYHFWILTPIVSVPLKKITR